ncbi:MAG: hypothetical protein V7L05_07790 [Nostoc sp.]|uniref:hypothetical protein n=1 Tax=Nostoc sp. TaxID=1180 RepID=UPI002FF68BB7
MTAPLAKGSRVAHPTRLDNLFVVSPYRYYILEILNLRCKYQHRASEGQHRASEGQHRASEGQHRASEGQH